IFHYSFICSEKTFTFPPHPVKSSRQLDRQTLRVQDVGGQPDVVLALPGRHSDHPYSQRWFALSLGIVGPVPKLSLGETLRLDLLQAVELCHRREPDQERALLVEQTIEQIIAHVTRIADQQHALEDRLGEGLQKIDQIAPFP